MRWWKFELFYVISWSWEWWYERRQFLNYESNAIPKIKYDFKKSLEHWHLSKNDKKNKSCLRFLHEPPFIWAITFPLFWVRATQTVPNFQKILSMRLKILFQIHCWRQRGMFIRDCDTFLQISWKYFLLSLKAFLVWTTQNTSYSKWHNFHSSIVNSS